MGILNKIGAWLRGAGDYLGDKAPPKPKDQGPPPSDAEQRLASFFPGWSTTSRSGALAGARAELARHFRGWDYVAMRPICEEIAGNAPQVGYAADPREAERALESAARRRGKSAPWLRRRKADLARRYLPRHERRKALIHLQAHEEIEPAASDHRLVELLRKPNKLDCAWTFAYKLAMYLELTGNSYLWVVNDGLGLPKELWPLPPHWVRPCGDGERLVGHYEVRPYSGYVATGWGDGYGWFAGGVGMMRLEAHEVIHVAYPSPMDFLDGYSPIAAIADWIDASESIDRSRVFSFTHGSFPGVAIEFTKEWSGGEPPTKEQIERFKAEFASKYESVRNTGMPIVLSPGVTIRPFTTTPREMDYAVSSDQMKSNIMAAHRTAPSIVGMSETNSYAAMVADRANFAFSTIKPKLTLLGQVLTADLCSRYPEGDRLRLYWPDTTPDDPQMRLQEWTAGMDRGAVTVDEYRQHVLHLAPWGTAESQNPLLPSSLAPAPLATGADLSGFGAKLPRPPAAPQPGAPPAGGADADAGGLFGGGGGPPEEVPDAPLEPDPVPLRPAPTDAKPHNRTTRPPAKSATGIPSRLRMRIMGGANGELHLNGKAV